MRKKYPKSHIKSVKTSQKNRNGRNKWLFYFVDLAPTQQNFAQLHDCETVKF